MEFILSKVLLMSTPSPIINWSFRNVTMENFGAKVKIEELKNRKLVLIVPTGIMGGMLTLLSEIIPDKEFCIIPMLHEPVLRDKPEFGLLLNTTLGLEVISSLQPRSKTDKLIFCFQVLYQMRNSTEWLHLSEVHLLRRFRNRAVRIQKVKVVSCLTDSSTLCFQTTDKEMELSSEVLLTKELTDDDILLQVINKKSSLIEGIMQSLSDLKRELYI